MKYICVLLKKKKFHVSTRKFIMKNKLSLQFIFDYYCFMFFSCKTLNKECGANLISCAFLRKKATVSLFFFLHSGSVKIIFIRLFKLVNFQKLQ